MRRPSPRADRGVLALCALGLALAATSPALAAKAKAGAGDAAALEARGYHPQVAGRIARDLPKLARSIRTWKRDDSGVRAERHTTPVPLANLGPRDGRPITLYRGVALPPARLDPTFAATRIPGLLFLSEQPDVPLGYASGASRMSAERVAQPTGTGTLLELQVPSRLVHFYGHPTLRTKDVPDVTPFIVRHAPIPFGVSVGHTPAWVDGPPR